jgi:hypothetical protein
LANQIFLYVCVVVKGEAIGAAILQQEATERPRLLKQRSTPAITECITIMYNVMGPEFQ